MCPQRFRKVPFSSVHRYTRKQRFQKFNSRERCRKVPFSLHKIRVDVSVKKKLRFQMKTNTCINSQSSPSTCIRFCLKTEIFLSASLA